MTAGHGGQILCCGHDGGGGAGHAAYGCGAGRLGRAPPPRPVSSQTISRSATPIWGESAVANAGLVHGPVPSPVASFMAHEPRAGKCGHHARQSPDRDRDGGRWGRQRRVWRCRRRGRRYPGSVTAPGGELAPVRDRNGVTEAVTALFSVTRAARRSRRRWSSSCATRSCCGAQQLRASPRADRAPRKHVGAVVPQLVVLATSREGLGVDGERIIPTPSLAAPPTPLWRRLWSRTRSAFEERTVAVTAGFELSDEPGRSGRSM